MEAAFLKLGIKDMGKAAIMLILGTIVTALLPILQGIADTGTLPVWADALKTLLNALISGVGIAAVYLLKNLLTNSDDKFLTKEATTEKKQ